MLLRRPAPTAMHRLDAADDDELPSVWLRMDGSNSPAKPRQALELVENWQ